MKTTLWAGSLVCLAMCQVALVVVTALQPQTSSGPPPPLPASPVDFPDYDVRTLANGLQVVVVQHHEQPAVSLRLLVRAGAAQDPADTPGVAALVATLLDQGTTTRSAAEIADAIDYVGGGLGTGAGSDLTFVNVLVMKDSFDLALDLLSDVARRPAFASAELERQRQQMLSGLQVSYQDPDFIANIVIDRLIYGFHPYGVPTTGTPESLEAIDRDDLVAFHDTYFVPNNAILAIVGDVSVEEALAGAERAFGDWARQEVPATTRVEPPAPTRRLVIVDRPGAVQTELRVGHLAIPRRDEDYLALQLASRILGGEGANRLHNILRSERGLTYGAEAELSAFRQAGDLIADTDTRSDATAEVLQILVDEFWRLQRERVGSRELAGAKAYMAGSFPLSIETPGAIALQILNVLFFGLDVDELETYRERVNAVSPDDIQRVARRYLQPSRLSIVLVGDASRFSAELEALGFEDYELIPLEELDLTSGTLRRQPVAAAP